MSIRIFLAAGLVLGLPTLLQAQYNNLRRAQQATMAPMEISGMIQGAARGSIVVADSTSRVWRVAVLPVTKVQVTGTATPASLKSGLIVEFLAEMDKGAISGKVDSLTITSLTREKQIGLFPSGAGDDGGSGFGGNGGGDSDKPAKHSGHTTKKAGAHAQASGSYRLVGKLVVGRDGKLSVQPGRGTLSFALADEPKINIEMADLSLARPGQEISVKGLVMPRQPGVLQAAEVKIKLPEPPAGDVKGPALKAEGKKSAKPAKDDKGEGLPAPAGDQ